MRDGVRVPYLIFRQQWGFNMTSAIAHWSINSRAKVVHMIRAKEYMHWFEGLRECEMHLLRNQMDLDEQGKELRKLKRLIEETNNKINGWQQTFLQAFGRKNRLYELQEYRSELRVAVQRVLISVRDSKMQLEAAQEEYDRIAEENQESLTLSYEDKQRILSAEALDRQHAMIIAGRALAARRQLPHDVGDLLVSLPPEKRDQVLCQALNLMNNAEIGAISQEAAAVLARFPVETRQAALILAAQTLSKSELTEGHNGYQH